MNFFTKPKFLKINAKRRFPSGLWTKCSKNNNLIYNKTLKESINVDPLTGHHFYISASERINSFLDKDSFIEKDNELCSDDPICFEAVSSYKDKIKQYQLKTGLKDAVISGKGTIGNIKIHIAIMDFSFLGASMGCVVGEKITRCIESAIKDKTPLIIISASGGARMHEGIFSLMQMGKTCAALAKFKLLNLPYISILTNPTMAGVMASFASLGDLILAEPEALIGFAGIRVIKETTQQELPQGFQTSEFLLEHGLIDQIVQRSEMRERVIFFLKAFSNSKKCYE